MFFSRILGAALSLALLCGTAGATLLSPIRYGSPHRPSAPRLKLSSVRASLLSQCSERWRNATLDHFNWVRYCPRGGMLSLQCRHSSACLQTPAHAMAIQVLWHLICYSRSMRASLRPPPPPV